MSTPIKPRTPSGVMELLPRDQIAFQRMLDTIRHTFEQFGFLPIETPVMELTDVLLTKSGGDTERQVYFVQSTGALDAATAGERPEMALRFDLTVPLARYVAEHEHDLAFPFRRYQMQRVYRGERAQRGRYREFYQCDIDVIGKDKLSARFDAEIPAVIAAVFECLQIGDFTIKLNNRKLLVGLLQSLSIEPAAFEEVLRQIDKTDKQGRDKTAINLREIGLSNVVVETLMHLLFDSRAEQDTRGREGHSDLDMAYLDSLLCMKELNLSNTLLEGVNELRTVLGALEAMRVPRHRYRIDPSIARGLDYYTGTVYETTLNQYPQIGSICSGGRYDNLASHYSKSKLPGVGISIGLTRLFYQLQSLGLVQNQESSVDVLVALLADEELPHSLELSTSLRNQGIAVETQLEWKKLAKQINYAERTGIRFMVISGLRERLDGVIVVKDLKTAEEGEIPIRHAKTALRIARRDGTWSRSKVPYRYGWKLGTTLSRGLW